MIAFATFDLISILWYYYLFFEDFSLRYIISVLLQKLDL